MRSNNFLELMEKSGVKDYFNKFGMELNDLFTKEIDIFSDTYSDYEWIVMPHSLDGLLLGMVIHAVPPSYKAVNNPWEEWFVYNGVEIHHILYKNENPKCESNVMIQLGDKDHPEAVQNQKWYYYNEKNMTPFMLVKE